MENKNIHYQINFFGCKISRFHPIKQIKKLDVISLKNNITKTLVPLCDSFNSSFNGSFYLRLKKY